MIIMIIKLLEAKKGKHKRDKARKRYERGSVSYCSHGALHSAARQPANTVIGRASSPSPSGGFSMGWMRYSLRPVRPRTVTTVTLFQMSVKNAGRQGRKSMVR